MSFRIFGFGKGKKARDSSDALDDLILSQQISGQIAKVQSLQKLGRGSEAEKLVRDVEATILLHIRKRPSDKRGHLLLSNLYMQSGELEFAREVLERLLSTEKFALTADERISLQGDLARVGQRLLIESGSTLPREAYTMVYSCQKCGRLHNHLNVPCPHCDWFAKSEREVAISIVLSNHYLKVSSLLGLAREVNNGRAPVDIVINLERRAIDYLERPEAKVSIRKLLTLLRDYEHKSHRSLNALRLCSNCDHRLLVSDVETCPECNISINWPPPQRVLVGIDNLLWLFENRLDIKESESISELICVLVGMVNDLLWNQQIPSPDVRRYALELVQKIGAIPDLGRGAVISTSNLHEIKVYLVKDCMREDSSEFAVFWHTEVDQFVRRMSG